MIVRPPSVDNNWFSKISGTEELNSYMPLYKVIDDKGRYLHWDELRHRIGEKDPVLVWSAVKNSRIPSMQLLGGLPFSLKGEVPSMNLIPSISRRCSFVDNWCSGPAFSSMLENMSSDTHLIKDLIEEESIASSQLEGASTTRRVAKEMLQTKREPRSIDEKMIVGNFKMMKFAWSNKDEELSVSFIKQLHEIGTIGIEDSKYCPGEFRSDNSVYVSNNNGEVLHQPPNYQETNSRLDMICKWGNIEHSELDTQDYIHPLVKATILHFSIGYEHPFCDGNGRVARALFYWCMFKFGYQSFKYISISKLFKKSPIKYGKSYLYTETDKYDLTYFIDYQCQVIEAVVIDFVSYIKTAIADRDIFRSWLFESRIYPKLNDRQQDILKTMGEGARNSFTTKYLETKYRISNNTARKDLIGLVGLGFLEEDKSRKSIEFRGVSGYNKIRAKVSNNFNSF